MRVRFSVAPAEVSVSDFIITRRRPKLRPSNGHDPAASILCLNFYDQS
jgi:hypothetical protein